MQGETFCEEKTRTCVLLFSVDANAPEQVPGQAAVLKRVYVRVDSARVALRSTLAGSLEPDPLDR